MAAKTYGTVSAERQKEMSGLEFVQGLASGTLRNGRLLAHGTTTCLVFPS
jgi:hypothetical protein